MSPADLDAVVVSHLHGDHFGGLPFLLIERQYGGGPQRPLTLIGPPGLAARLDAAMQALYPRDAPRPWAFALDIREIAPGETTRFAGLSLAAFEVGHPSGAPSLGWRIGHAGKALAYSGDTGWTPALAELAARRMFGRARSAALPSRLGDIARQTHGSGRQTHRADPYERGRARLCGRHARPRLRTGGRRPCLRNLTGWTRSSPPSAPAACVATRRTARRCRTSRAPFCASARQRGS